jgi:hypothetical protein
VPAGILVAEAGLAIANKLTLGRTSEVTKITLRQVIVEPLTTSPKQP